MGGYIKKKICGSPNCSNYALPNSAYCQEHQKEINRDTTSKFCTFYHSSFWKKARKKFLSNHIWCEKCLKEKGVYKPANVIHHSQGFVDFSSFADQSKWVAWCKECHSAYHTTITNEELYERNKNVDRN